MIRVYYLPVQTIEGIETIAGIEYVHDALLETTESPDSRKLIMDTTTDEDTQLSAVALEARDATQEEIDLYNAQVVITPPDPDTIRAEELLATSPQVITMPEMWELIRIYGRRLGFRF